MNYPEIEKCVLLNNNIFPADEFSTGAVGCPVWAPCSLPSRPLSCRVAMETLQGEYKYISSSVLLYPPDEDLIRVKTIQSELQKK